MSSSLPQCSLLNPHTRWPRINPLTHSLFVTTARAWHLTQSRLNPLFVASATHSLPQPSHTATHNNTLQSPPPDQTSSDVDVVCHCHISPSGTSLSFFGILGVINFKGECYITNQTCFQNPNLLKIKTVFKKWKQEIKIENENTNQTHPKFSLLWFEIPIESVYKQRTT